MADKIYSRGVRGAITVDDNSQSAIKEATVVLLDAMIKENEIETKDIAFAIFTLTPDINAAFPAKYARAELDFSQVPMMCYNELDVEGSIQKCLRILLNINTSKEQNEIKHIYLKGASVLRQDLKQ